MVLGFKFAKFDPNDYVLKYRNGSIVKEGPGLSFFYFVPNTSIVVVPTNSIDVPFIFEELTADFQNVTVQGQITYRIIEPKKIAQLLNYTIDLKRKIFNSEDPQKLSQRIINLIKVLAKKHLELMPITESIKSSEELAGKLSEKIKVNTEITSLGIEILAFSLLAIKPNSETERALEAQTREQILKRADEAIYERRNASILQERKVKENELNTEIAVENKKREIKETQMEAEKLIQQKNHELKDKQMEFETALEEKRKSLISLTVENSKAEADAKAYELTAVMKSLEGIKPVVIETLANVGMQPSKLIAMAFQEIAEKADKIGQLNISPDLLQEIIKGK